MDVWALYGDIIWALHGSIIGVLYGGIIGVLYGGIIGVLYGSVIGVLDGMDVWALYGNIIWAVLCEYCMALIFGHYSAVRMPLWPPPMQYMFVYHMEQCIRLQQFHKMYAMYATFNIGASEWRLPLYGLPHRWGCTSLALSSICQTEAINIM